MTEDFKRTVPLNELDFNMSTTETVWYSQEISPILQKELTHRRFIKDNKGELIRDKNGVPLVELIDYSGKLKIQTRDNRLSNLDSNGYLETRWFDGFASDSMLLGDLPRSTTHCIMQKDSILNLSQSKRGWFRKIMNTLFQHSKFEGSEPDKKKMFGGRAE